MFPRILAPVPITTLFPIGGVALAFFLAGPAQRNALIQQDVVADLGGLADHHPHAVVDEEPPADLCARVNLDPGGRAIDLRNNASQQNEARFVKPVRQPMQQDGVEAGIAKEDFNRASGGGIASKDGVDLFPDCSKHAAYI